MLEKINRDHQPIPLREIINSISNNNVELFKNQLPFINVDQIIDEDSLLHWAIHYNAVEIIKVLLENKCSVEVFNKFHGTPLVTATLNNKVEIMNLLLLAGANIHDISPILIKGGSPLHVASRKGFLESTALLLNYNANINVQTLSENYTPLSLSIIYEHKNIFDLLMEKKAEIVSGSEKKSNLALALESGNEYFVFKLLESYKEQHSNHPWILATDLVLAILNNDLDKTEELIPYLTIDIDTLRWGTARLIHIAAKNNNLEILKLLILSGADISVLGFGSDDYKNVLCFAAESNAVLIINFLINEIQFDMDTLNQALKTAVLDGYLESVKILINAGGNIENLLCNDRYIPQSLLSKSVEKKYYEITEYLLSKGAKTHRVVLHKHIKKVHPEISPLHIALKEGNFELAISFVMKDKILLDIPETFNGDKPILSWIKKNLATERNPNCLSIMLAFSILSKDLLCAKLLIEKGADIYAEIFDGKSSWQLSQECDCEKIQEVIYDTAKALKIGQQILSKADLKPGSLLFISAKIASKHILQVNNGAAFFKNIPEKLDSRFTETYQKIIVEASDHSNDIVFEEESSEEKFDNFLSRIV